MWPNPQETVDLVTFTAEILKEKLHFLCSVRRPKHTSSEDQKSSVLIMIKIANTLQILFGFSFVILLFSLLLIMWVVEYLTTFNNLINV